MPAIPAKLVTIITVFSAQLRIERGLAKLGAKAYSLAKVDGRGQHGHQRDGIVDSANVQFSIVAHEKLAMQILEWVEREIASSEPVIAYAADVIALPSNRVD